MAIGQLNLLNFKRRYDIMLFVPKSIKYLVRTLRRSQIFKPAIQILDAKYAGYLLKQRITQLDENDLKGLIDLAFSFYCLGIKIKPAQVEEEILQLLYILKDLKPKYLMEIGTFMGGTLFLFCQVADPNAVIISVDLPYGRFGGGYPKWRIPLYKSFVKSNQKLYLFRLNSHDPKTFKLVQNTLNNQLLDFLFIDGDHSYEGVKLDFEMYSPLVRRGGIIAFHDIVPGPEKHVGGVPIFWNEIKNQFKTLEIVKDWNRGKAGIGVIFK
jgi:predicted O-methyltransferase YrrM